MSFPSVHAAYASHKAESMGIVDIEGNLPQDIIESSASHLFFLIASFFFSILCKIQSAYT